MTIQDLKNNIGIDGASFEGTIKRVYQQRSMPSQFGTGQFKVQDLDVADSTGEIRVSLRNHPEIPQGTIGSKIVCKSKFVESQGKNMGVKVAKEFFRVEGEGKERELIKAIVTPSADVGLDVNSVRERPQQEKPKSQSEGAMPTPAEVVKSAIAEAARILGDPDVVMALAMVREHGWTSEDLRTMANALAIEANRRMHNQR